MEHRPLILDDFGVVRELADGDSIPLSQLTITDVPSLNALSHTNDIIHAKPYYLADRIGVAVGVGTGWYRQCVMGGAAVNSIAACTRTEYESLTPDAATLYLIIE